VKLEDFLSLDDKLNITLWRDATHGEDFHYTSSILDLQNGKILIYAPPENADAFDWMTKGEKLRIIVKRSNGIWSFFPTIGQSILKGSPSVWLTLPDDIEQLQRRTHVRVKHTFPLQIKLETQGLPQPPVAVTVQAPTPSSSSLLQAIDVSAGGIRFKTELLLSADQPVSVTFTLSPTLGKITANAKIVYCFNPDTLPATSAYARRIVPAKAVGSKTEYIAALSFVNLPKDIEKRIIQDCFHLELEQHRKRIR
jgi:c-di-GMP-binding flagellar brake protein YcgR